MRAPALCCIVVALVGCAKSENKAPAESAANPPPHIALADVAGKWAVKAMNEAKDTTLVTYQLTATADTTGWMITFPNRPPIPVRVSVAGADVVADAGPYPSVLRKNVQVWTHSMMHLDNGMLVGTTVAHYSVTTADSVRRLATEGTRAP
jgi:hypothetical protein